MERNEIYIPRSHHPTSSEMGESHSALREPLEQGAVRRLDQNVWKLVSLSTGAQMIGEPLFRRVRTRHVHRNHPSQNDWSVRQRDQAALGARKRIQPQGHWQRHLDSVASLPNAIYLEIGRWDTVACNFASISRNAVPLAPDRMTQANLKATRRRALELQRSAIAIGKSRQLPHDKASLLVAVFRA